MEPLAIDATGDRIAYATPGPNPGAVAGAVFAARMARRGAGGWNGAAVGYPYSMPAFTGQIPLPFGASEDMSTWVWHSPVALLPGAPVAPGSGWYRGAADGPLTLLGEGGESSIFAGVSSDAQHVVFQTSSKLLPGDDGRTDGSQVYEYAGTTLRLVGVDSSGALLSPCGAVAGSPTAAPNPVSLDGERIFVTSPGFACDVATPRVFVRQDGSTTTEISASRCTRPDCNAPAEVHFMGATPSGSVAFVATSQQLTDDDVDSSRDLYRFDVAGGTLSRVSVGAPAVDADVVATRAYPSDDGSRVYFLANGELVPGQGVSGTPNLYVADGSGVRFVATLDTSDGWPAGGINDADLSEVALTPGSAGRIVFATIAALRPDDTDLAKDIYLYDADDGALVRVSGMPGSGNGGLPAETKSGGLILDRPPFPLNVPRVLSDDGRRVFVTTAESLLPEDVDDVDDVYEWFDGSLGLVSPNAGGDDVIFLGASRDGSTAFFSTGESLVAADDDGGDYDLYAARLGGGFPEQPPAPPECVGDACRPPLPGRLSRPDPASLTHLDQSTGRLRVRLPGRTARLRMAARGRLTLGVTAPLAGRVSATASARIGRRVRVVARGDMTVAGVGRVTLSFPLSRAARQRLASGRELRVRVVLRHSRLDRATVAPIRLEGAR